MSKSKRKRYNQHIDIFNLVMKLVIYEVSRIEFTTVLIREMKWKSNFDSVIQLDVTVAQHWHRHLGTRNRYFRSLCRLFLVVGGGGLRGLFTSATLVKEEAKKFCKLNDPCDVRLKATKTSVFIAESLLAPLAGLFRCEESRN